LQCVAVCCSVLQCAAVCCSVLQCVAVCCITLQSVVSHCLTPVAYSATMYAYVYTQRMIDSGKSEEERAG